MRDDKRKEIYEAQRDDLVIKQMIEQKVKLFEASIPKYVQDGDIGTVRIVYEETFKKLIKDIDDVITKRQIQIAVQILENKHPIKHNEYVQIR